jgi:hypothetical protein
MSDSFASESPARAEDLPPSIRLFERLQGCALVVGWANATLTYHDLLRDRVNPLLFTSALCAGSAFVFLLIAQISRGRSSSCRWILIVLTAAGAGPWFVMLQHIGAVNANSLLSIAQGALQLGSCALLLASDSRAWFAGAEE